MNDTSDNPAPNGIDRGFTENENSYIFQQSKKKGKSSKKKKKNQQRQQHADENTTNYNELDLFWIWLRSLRWDELRSSMYINFKSPEDRKQSSRSTTHFSLHEQELLLDMIRLLPCAPTPIHPKALSGLFNVSSVDDGRNQESLSRKNQYQKPRLFQFVKCNINSFNFDFDVSNMTTVDQKALYDDNIIPTRNTIPSIGRKRERIARGLQRSSVRSIDTKASSKTNAVDNRANTVYQVIARKFLMDDGERLSIGTTREQQDADQAIIQNSVWNYEYNVKEGKHNAGIQFDVDAIHSPISESYIDEEQLRYVIRDKVIRILKIASRGQFGSCIPTPHSENETLSLAPWMKPDERWFSLSMYLTSCYEVSLWTAYRRHIGIDAQNVAGSLPPLLTGVTDHGMRTLLYHATQRCTKELMKRERDSFNNNSKEVVPFRTSIMRLLINFDTRELLKNSKADLSRYPVQLREVLEISCPLLEVDFKVEKWKGNVWKVFCKTVSEAYRQSLVQQLLKDQFNNDSDETHRIVNRKVDARTPSKRRKNKNRELQSTAVALHGEYALENLLIPERTKDDTTPLDTINFTQGVCANPVEQSNPFESHEIKSAAESSLTSIIPTPDGNNLVHLDQLKLGLSEITIHSDGALYTEKDIPVDGTVFELVERRGKKKANRTRGSDNNLGAKLSSSSSLPKLRIPNMITRASKLESIPLSRPCITDVIELQKRPSVLGSEHSIPDEVLLASCTEEKCDGREIDSHLKRSSLISTEVMEHKSPKKEISVNTVCEKVVVLKEMQECVAESGELFVRESCSTVKRSNLGNAIFPTLDNILDASGVNSAAQPDSKLVDFNAARSNKVGPCWSPSSENTALLDAQPIQTLNIPVVGPSAFLSSQSFPISKSAEIVVNTSETPSNECIQHSLNASSGEYLASPTSTTVKLMGSSEHRPNCVPTAASQRISPAKESSPVVKYISLEEKDKYSEHPSFDKHPPILSFGSDPSIPSNSLVTGERNIRSISPSFESLRSPYELNKTRIQEPVKMITSPRPIRPDAVLCRSSPSTNKGFVAIRTRDDHDIKSKANNVARRSADTHSVYRARAKRASTFRDDQDIKSESNRERTLKMSSYATAGGQGNLQFNGSWSSARTQTVEAYKNYNEYTLESTVSCADVQEFTTQSEAGFEHHTDQQFLGLNFSTGNEDFDNNTPTRDCSTTLSSPDTQRDSDEVALLRDERNSYRDMCLTLGAEVAKLKNLIAAQGNTAKHPSAEYSPGCFPIPIQNAFPLSAQTVSHHAFQFAPRARTLAAMSDTGCVDQESLASEDEVGTGRIGIDSVRHSSSLTITGSDTSLDPGSVHNVVPMRFTIKSTRDGPDPVSLNGMQSRLTKDVLRFLDSIHSQLRKQDPKRRFAIDRMTKLVNALWPRAQVKLYGSHVTGLCLPSSDLDFVVCLPAVHKNTMAIAAGELEVRNAINESSQKLLARRLKAESWIDPRSMKLIERTVVPVIKVSTKDVKSRMIQLDITFDAPNHHGRDAATMAAQTMEELPMIRPIVIVLKQFLLDRGLLTAYTGGLSSYCLFQMVARYLQEQPSSWGDCGALLMGFLDFYGNCFDPRTTGISVKHRLYFQRPNYATFRNQPTRQTLWNPVAQPHPSRSGSVIPSQRRNSFNDKGSTDVYRGIPPRFTPAGNFTPSNVGAHGINHAGADAVHEQSVFDHGMPYTFDPLFVEDPLSETNNVGRNAFRIFQVQRAFSDAHRALVAALEWDIQSDGDLQESSEYPLLKCLLQSEDTIFDL